jgi:hypothetical protein
VGKFPAKTEKEKKWFIFLLIKSSDFIQIKAKPVQSFQPTKLPKQVTLFSFIMLVATV